MSVTLVQGEELKLLGKTVIYENGSWVNPEEPKFKLTSPKAHSNKIFKKKIKTQ